MENLEKGKAIDIRRLLPVLWKNAGLILLVGVLTASIVFGYLFFFITPMYSAGTKMRVNNALVESPYVSASQVTAAKDLAETYMVVFKSRDVLVKVKDVSALDYSVSQIASMISAKRIGDTETFQVTVTCENSEHAYILAAAIQDVLPRELENVITGSEVVVFESAYGSGAPVNRNFTTTTILAAGAGMAVTVLIIVLFELIDTRIRTEDVLLNEYKEIPLLAVIPGEEHVKYGNYKYYKGHYQQKQEPSEEEQGEEDGGDAQ